MNNTLWNSSVKINRTTLFFVWREIFCTQLILCDVRQHLVRPCGLSICTVSHQDKINIISFSMCVILDSDFCLKSIIVGINAARARVHWPHKKTHSRWPCWQQCENYLWRRCTEQGSDTFLEQNEAKKKSERAAGWAAESNLLPGAESTQEVNEYLMQSSAELYHIFSPHLLFWIFIPPTPFKSSFLF